MLPIKLWKNFRSTTFFILIFVLTGCSDGIDGTGVVSNGEKVTLEGTAAEGAPIKNAKVTIKGSGGKKVTGTTNSEGKFAIEFSNLKAPYLLKIERENKSDLYSITSEIGIINIHPLTDLITRNWFAVHGYSAETEFNSEQFSITLPSNEAIIAIGNYFKWLITLSVFTIAPIESFYTAFDADGTGFDYVLDFIDINIRHSKINVSVIDPDTLIKVKIIDNVDLDTDFIAEDYEAPSKPTGLRAIASGDNTIVIAWNSSHDNRGISGYQIYQDGEQINFTSLTMYKIQYLIPGKVYCFAVEAIGDFNTSLRTTEACLTPLAGIDTSLPSAITDLTAHALGSATIQLNWTPPIENDVLAYEIHSKVRSKGYTRITTIMSPPYLDINPSTAEDMCYIVFAVDAAKNKSLVSNEACAGVISDVNAPGTTVSILGGTYAEAQSVRLKCDDGLLDSGCATTYYTLDGSTPSTTSLVYTGPITINTTTTIRFISIDNAGNIESSTKPENSQRYTIEYDGSELVPGLEFSSTNYQISETAGAAVITVRRNGDATGFVTVEYTISNGTATADLDYTAENGALWWPDNYAEPRTIIIPIKADNFNDFNETVILTLQNPRNTTLAINSTATLTIHDVPCNGILNTNISRDTTITESCTVVTSDIQVNNNASLKITPGSTLLFEYGTGLNINNGSYLTANGSILKPIVFSSVVAQAGNWKGIQFTGSNNINNFLNYTTVEYGGLTSNANVQIDNQSSATIMYSTLSHSSGYGLQVFENAKLNKLYNNKLFANGLNPIQLDVNQISALDYSSHYNGNTIDTIDVIGNTIVKNQFLEPLDVAYSFGDVSVVGSPQNLVSLFIVEGTTIKFRDNGKLTITEFSQLEAYGSLFTADSSNPLPGHWQGIYFNGTSLGNILDYVTVEYAGRSNTVGSANIYNGSSSIGSGLSSSIVGLNMSNSISRFSAGYGLEISSFGNVKVLWPQNFSNNIFTNNDLQPISTPIRNIDAIDSSNQLTGNSIDEIYISNGDVTTDAVWPKTEVNYSINNLNITATLTVEPGVDISVRAGGAIDVSSGGSLNAVGTSALPIIMRGEVSPAMGYWQGVNFFQSDSNLNKLQFVNISDAGSGNDPNLGFGNIVVGASSSAIIEDCIISDSASYGIYRSAFATTFSQARNTFINMTLSPDVYLQP